MEDVFQFSELIYRVVVNRHYLFITKFKKKLIQRVQTYSLHSDIRFFLLHITLYSYQNGSR